MTDSQPPSLLDFIVDRTHAGIFVVNRDMELVLWNQFMEVHSGRKAQTLLGKNLFDAFPELPRKWLARKVENVFILKNFSFTSWEQRPYLFKFPHNRPVTGGVDCMRQDCTLMPVKNTAGDVEYVCFTLFDVTDTSIYQQQLTALTQELREVGDHDGLTQLFNRRYIEETLSKEFRRAQRYEHPLTTILTDIDHFKQVNDTHGHLAGDEVLRIISRRLQNSLRDTDILGRYGGEEFLIVLPNTGTKGGKVLAERLRHAIESEPVAFGDIQLTINISLGITELREDSRDYEQLIGEADLALYQSKEGGRNQATIFTADKPAN
ncbi:diguanylate cyclase (GGDEF domain) with PAS/PAC sensor [hydrothermal vent metagenome]|uniref:Diguanylate cyclase (GGDEF domain) with PAS/PAC sensor n=1 Tax=hydrothermal vent metagenome TaxID=652676 RepID=A0A3B1AVT6_9ZZZZ